MPHLSSDSGMIRNNGQELILFVVSRGSPANPEETLQTAQVDVDAIIAPLIEAE